MKFVHMVKIREYNYVNAKIGTSSRCLPVLESWWSMQTSTKTCCELPPGAFLVNEPSSRERIKPL
jgi:hypothetical protein